MITVDFLGPIGKDSMKLDVNSLSQLKAELAKEDELAQWLQNCSVAVNDELVSSLDTPLQSGDRVSLLPPVCGG